MTSDIKGARKEYNMREASHLLQTLLKETPILPMKYGNIQKSTATIKNENLKKTLEMISALKDGINEVVI